MPTLQTRDQYSFPFTTKGLAVGVAGYDASDTFRVPSGVHRVYVEVVGGNGLVSNTAGASVLQIATPGSRALAVLDVTPGQVLTVTISASPSVSGKGITTVQATQGCSGSTSITGAGNIGSGSSTAGSSASGGNINNTSSVVNSNGFVTIWW